MKKGIITGIVLAGILAAALVVIRNETLGKKERKVTE